MRGIDISHWNGWPFNGITEQGYQESDFVICKATQGTKYSKADYFAKAIARASKDGKLIGAYHYASGGDPVAEADYFVAVVDGYIGKALLALDWEPGSNKAWRSTTWARRFVDRVHSKTGVWPLIYTGGAGVKQCASCMPDCRLWFAGYPVGENSWDVPKWPSRYKISPWLTYSIWQFTSGGMKLDRNVSGMTKAEWKYLAKGRENAQNDAGAKEKPKAEKTTPKAKTTYQGEFPKLPSRGYYKYNDGIRVLVKRRPDIKRMQALVNWIAGEKLKVDGKFGAYTLLGVKAAQKMLGVESDGKFGPATLAAAKLYKG